MNGYGTPEVTRSDIFVYRYVGRKQFFFISSFSDLTYELMTAQCFVFFLAGFETSSSVQSFCLYEISLNQEIQERLHKEIEETISKHGGLTYRAIQDMQYLNMVVNGKSVSDIARSSLLWLCQ